MSTVAIPKIVRTRINHVRRTPIRHEFTYRSYSWLVDLDELPKLRWPLSVFARFRAADHVGDPSLPLRENVDAYLASEGVDLRGGSVRMLTNARVLGYVFNPLTLYWCHDDADQLACVIAEVHNTYGGRHRYLLRPDLGGSAVVAKSLYVSPFNDVSGSYFLRVPEPKEQLAVSIALRTADGATTFTAAMTGPVRTAGTSTVLRALVSAPLAPLVVSARIRWQGLRLWARGLPIHPRPNEKPSAMVQRSSGPTVAGSAVKKEASE
ncbi:MAG: DUF1365 domain-containing protein [Rhodococcus sp.]|nr:DUF1365 domain-containing protein [Rhodococcus sp. (in: high G+C Gram-positive bacteria)]